MDELEFRRALLADPNAQSDEILSAIAKDPSKKQYLEDVREFDAKIKVAVKVDVPEDLASKLILRQAMQSDDNSEVQAAAPVRVMEAANDRKFWHIAAAACVAFFIGLTLNLRSVLPEADMGAGEYALKYTHQNLSSLDQTNQQVSLSQVNAKLASYGVQMEQDIGQVYFADFYHCNYNKVNVLRLVVEGEAGNISVYVLPKENILHDWDEFNDSRFNGKAIRYSNADIVIVGEKDEPLKAFQSKVENSMKWSI